MHASLHASFLPLMLSRRGKYVHFCYLHSFFSFLFVLHFFFKLFKTGIVKTVMLWLKMFVIYTLVIGLNFIIGCLAPKNDRKNAHYTTNDEIYSYYKRKSHPPPTSIAPDQGDKVNNLTKAQRCTNSRTWSIVSIFCSFWIHVLSTNSKWTCLFFEHNQPEKVRWKLPRNHAIKPSAVHVSVV
jgi:hypothetical protein